MPSMLQKLLGIDERLFEAGIKALEKSTGNAGIDVRLIADLIENGHKCMRQLGLDPADTEGRELYHSLMASVKSGKAEDMLKDFDYVLIRLGNKIISFNLIDIIENSHHQLPYEDQTYTHGRKALRGELVSRYINHCRTHDKTTREIAASMGILID
jgi:hypothetical protein